MAEVTYTDVVWTAGDVITEAKMDNMTANDRAVDAMYQGIQLTERSAPATPPANTLHLYAKDKNGASTLYVIDDSGYEVQLGEINRAYGFYIAGTPSVANDLSWNPSAYADQTAVQISAHCKTAPTGANLIMRVYNVTKTQDVASITILASATDATSTSMTNSAISASDILRVDVTQVGSTIAGADISVILDITES